jgi:hypothetical protein
VDTRHNNRPLLGVGKIRSQKQLKSRQNGGNLAMVFMRFAPVQPPFPKLNQNRVRPSPYPNSYHKISIPRTYISYSSTSVPYERYPSHIRADADYRRCRPSTRSPLPPSNLATTAAKQSGSGGLFGRAARAAHATANIARTNL